MTIRSRHSWRHLAHLSMVIGLLGALLSVVEGQGTSVAAATRSARAVPTQIGWGLSHTAGVVTAGSHVWTLSDSGAYLTQFSAKSGAYEQTVEGTSYGFAFPTSLAVSGKHLWIADYNNSLIEISAETGAFEQRITDSSYGISRPDAVVAIGSDVWVANSSGNSLTRINGRTGALKAVLSDPSYGFASPRSMAARGTTLWVSNQMGDSVVGINSSDNSVVTTIANISEPGKLTVSGANLWIGSGTSEIEYDTSRLRIIRTLSDSSYGFGNSVGIAASTTRVWFGNVNTNTTTLVNATTGAILKHLSAADRGFAVPTSMAISGSTLWVANYGNVGLIAMNKRSGALIKTISASSENFGTPTGIAKGPNHTLWITSYDNDSVTELSSLTGKVIRVINDPSFGLNEPFRVIASGNNIWVANHRASSLTEIDAISGALIRVITPTQVVSPISMCVAGTHLFVGNADHGVSELDATTGDLITSFADVATPRAMVASGGYVYVTGTTINGVYRLSNGPDASEITYDVGYAFNSPSGITAVNGHIWVVNDLNNTLVELNQATGAQEAVLADASYQISSPTALTSANGLLYVTNFSNGTIAVIDADTLAPVEVLGNGTAALSHPSSFVVASGSLWITNYTSRSVTRIPL